MSFEDFSWGVLEKFRLDSFFDKHNLPPQLFIIFLLAIVAIAAFILLISSQPGAPQTAPACGDSVCQAPNETVMSCPSDCQIEETARSKVTVRIVGEVAGNVNVLLEDSSGTTIDRSNGRADMFLFTDVEADVVVATVRNPANGESIRSSEAEVLDGAAELLIRLPPGFFDPPASPKGTLKLMVTDLSTSQAAKAKVAVFTPTDGVDFPVFSEEVTGVKYLALEANKWYSVIAEADGYNFYDARQAPVMIAPSEERELKIELEPLAAGDFTQPAMLKACVLDQAGNVPVGSVEVQTVYGVKVAEEGIINGCTTFELTAGANVKIMPRLPSSCLPQVTEHEVAAGTNDLLINVTCGVVGRARAKVVNQSGSALTQSATVMMKYSNGSQICGTGNSCALASLGEYTEYASISPSAKFRFVVSAPGYAAYSSSDYEVAALENKTFVITLQLPPPPVYNFTFSGISFDNPVAVGRPLTVTLSKVLYGQTDVTAGANVSFSLAGTACNVSRSSVWAGRCTAPATPGEYDLAISAAYGGQTGSTVKELAVLEAAPAGYLTLVPHALLDEEPPIHMDFDVTFNGAPLDSLTDSEVTILYEEGDVKVGTTQLAGSNGLYSIDVDTPYPGEHSALINVVKANGSRIYEQNFTVYFDSRPDSLTVTSSQSINPVISAPGESVKIYATVKYNGQEVPNLGNVYVTVSNQRSAMPWDPSGHIYSKSYFAPSLEGIYPVKFELEYQKLSDKTLYVVDTAKSKSATCDIGGCDTIPDVRRCVDKHKRENMYSQDDVIDCIESGWVSYTDISHCLSSDAGRGDWYQSCKLDSSDTAAMSDALNRITDPAERNTYSACGDMDNDGDVDSDDLTCLTNVVATKWFGDVGDVTCQKALRGGFCFDIKQGMPGDFDDDSKLMASDVSVMWLITDAASAGVTPPEDLLDIADFNSDGAITGTDQNCLAAMAGTGSIATSCLAIYPFGCAGVRGDLDQDGDITEIDLLLESWVVNNRVIGMWCADMNKDNIYDEDDYLCVKAILDGDTAAQEEYCTACIVKMQRLGRYGDEICHDGLDNDCDDLIDDADNGECDDCEEGQTCDREYDSDSVYNTDDFKYCKHISEIPNVGDGDWEWLFDDDLEDMCESCSDWKLHWACGRGTDQETGSTCLPDCSGEVEWAGIPEVECSSLGTYMKGVAGVECPSEACVAVKACGSGYRVTNANACPNTWVDISAYLRHGAPTEAEVGTIPTGSTETVTRCCVPGPCTACTTLTPVTTASCTRTSGGGGKGGHRPSRP